jgi:hypothetical protein
MGIRCTCRATASTINQDVEFLINGELRRGILRVDLNICPNCLPRGSFVNLIFTDVINAQFNFTFTSNMINLPNCELFQSLVLTTSGTGTLTIDFLPTPLPATLNHIFLDGFIGDPGLFICDTLITANGNTVQQAGGACVFAETGEIDSCS